MHQRHAAIRLKKFESPIGTMLAGATDEGICLLEFTDRQMLESELTRLCKLLNAQIEEGGHQHITLLQKQLNEYFGGERRIFSLPLVLPGTPFQQAVWRELQNIPFGVTRTYKEQSLALKNLQAIRAVAHANGMNRIAIVVPCHRVIGAQGSLTGYGGGLWRKKWLLDLEAKTVSKQMELTFIQTS